MRLPPLSHANAAATTRWRVLPLGLTFAAWSALLAGIGVWNASVDYQTEMQAATFVAIDNFNRDLVYRRWASQQGGVYIAISENNPRYSSQLVVPERQITTPSGRELTLVNPGCLNRLVHELGSTPFRVTVHITSLKPLRPENAADAWETQGLRQFEKGDKETVSLEVLDGAPFVRFMRPLLIETDCLTCHAGEGYTLGDVRGGVSVSVPWGPFRKNWLGHVLYDSTILAGIWLIGCVGVVVSVMWRRNTRQVIAERERTGSLLQVERDRAQQYLDVAGTVVVGLASDQTITLINRSGSELLDYPRDEIVGKNWVELVVPERERDTVKAVFLNLISREVAPGAYHESGIVTRSGEMRLISWHHSLIRDAAGAIVGTLSSGQDITERKRAEGSLRESEERYRRLFESAGDAILLLKDDVFIDCNTRALEMIGCLREEVVGHPFSVLAPPLQPSGGDTTDLAREKILAAREGRPQRFEWLLRRKSGASFLAEVSLSPFQIEGAPHLLGIVRDISEQRDLERRLLQAQKMEAIGTLAGGIAHDFNNILSIIVGYSQIALLRIPRESAAVESLQQVLAAGKRASDLVAQILLFSRMADARPRPCELGPILKETLKFLRASIPSTIRFRESISPVAPVIMDPTQIHQLVMNLCTNAFHAMEKSGGVLEVALQEVLVDVTGERQTGILAGRYARLTVSDSGAGIPSEIRDRIFEPYFTTKEAEKGTGLGLALVHGIVTKAGGAIRLTSAPGMGTTFQIYLPVAAADGPVAESASAPEAPRGTERILVVDDEPLVGKVTLEMLESLGYSVTMATDSLEALERFSANPDAFDLVITDLTMPKLSGVILVRELRALRPRMPIILYTGFSEHLAGERLWDLDIAATLAKPVSREHLAVAIRRALAGGAH